MKLLKKKGGGTRFVHYCSLFLVVALCAFYIAAGNESMTFYRAICSDKIYEARSGEMDVILPFDEITAIKQDTEYAKLFVVSGSAGQTINITDEPVLKYLVEQSGVQVQYAN